ncbi:SDR family NAD(P)-dependent oxidoreductase [Lysobacter pythonis]|uniref:SDR family NAD(P)-dependent oxidoreductase n=1 Tax=Solilutibacter pythonis TaxID=2483112 RepID=A0A3M2HMW0_9GAMM|nr:SDR family NAD(P)-dependent oxidoreductase [Lysobacter pythonis]RMH88679.1 SDR family NAD(P)-dependent oxidoreductase [Lysobacter pythonis]
MSAGKSLEGRVVFVAGATGGLGEAASLACARAGATLVLSGRQPRKLDKLYDAVKSAGPEPLLYPMDLEGASPDDHLELAQRLKDAFGRLDGLLHCAAEFRALTPLEYTDPAHVARAMHINVTAPMWLTMALMPVLKASDDASVVFVVDDAEHAGKPFWGPYAISQQSRAALVAQWAAEMEGAGVRICGLQPGPMRTPLRGRATVEDVDPNLRNPEAYAGDCVRLLSPTGRQWNGRIDRVMAGHDVARPEARSARSTKLELPLL